MSHDFHVERTKCDIIFRCSREVYRQTESDQTGSRYVLDGNQAKHDKGILK